MYLKSIEIQGFKSFANKILFEFHNGITGIVGPNGSGKSNVADAVRWVLGEQRVKQLRGGSMQDVIFAGTQLRKPQGFAYVAITLDNSDHKLPVSFDEVTISRRLYRSGESEYKINGSPCRLKDINEMFYDTGIGKEGYSIIGQGQIDKILSGRPEERRELFDEAAGIVKFKRRKLIAQKKLEDEKQNLIRVTDILLELEKQVGPLKKQSEAAREYLRLRDSLKSYDANLFLTESAALRTQISSLEEKEGIVSGDLESVRGASRQLKEEYESVSRALEQLEEEINGKREAVSQSGMVRQGLEGRINVLNEQINTERLNEEHIRSRITAIDAELAKKGEQKASYEQEKNGLSGEIAEIMSALSEAEARLKDKDTSIAATEQQMEEAKAAIIAALNEKAGLAARRQRYETMLEQVDVRRAELSQKLLKSKSEESVQEEQLKETQQQLSDLLEQLQQLSERETALTEEVSAAEEEVRRLNKLLNNTQQEYHTGYTKLESLRNLAERYDGYGGSIRRVMEVRDRIFGIHGVVADIVSTEKKYETAIETALGGSIQNIVTDSEQTAKQLIEYLKKNRYGRATFLPLTSMKHSQAFSQPAALKEPGVLGLASSLVKAEKEYGGLVEYLLGRVVVVDHIDHAIALAKKFRYSLRIVTLDGELLSAGGSMTGGAFKNSSNLLGRRREIEELEAQCKKALVKVDSIQKDLVLNEGILEEARENLVLVKEDIQKKRISENTIRIKMRQLEEKKQEIAESATDLVLENEELEEQLRELRGNREQLLSEAGQLERLGEEKDQETRKAAAILEQLKTEREQCAVSLSEVQLSASRIRQRDSFIGENIRRVSEEEAALLDERSRLEQGSTGSGESIAAREAQIASLWEEIQKETKQAEILETAMQELLQKKEEQAGRQKGFFDKKEELSQRMNLLDRDLLRLQNQREKLSERLEASVQYMWNEYELT
ncbi:MAG: chromosome segregation protein SMC, partial [Clostridium sp.]|nr:chromosome segregation protein SMC [Clostridium sp.]